MFYASTLKITYDLWIESYSNDKFVPNPFRPIHYTGVADLFAQSTICNKNNELKPQTESYGQVFTSPSVLVVGSMKIVIIYTNQNLKKF